jgi:hypothetical protein
MGALPQVIAVALNEFLQQQMFNTDLQNVAQRADTRTRRRNQLEELVIEFAHIRDKMTAVFIHRIPLRTQ